MWLQGGALASRSNWQKTSWTYRSRYRLALPGMTSWLRMAAGIFALAGQLHGHAAAYPPRPSTATGRSDLSSCLHQFLRLAPASPETDQPGDRLHRRDDRLGNEVKARSARMVRSISRVVQRKTGLIVGVQACAGPRPRRCPDTGVRRCRRRRAESSVPLPCPQSSVTDTRPTVSLQTRPMRVLAGYLASRSSIAGHTVIRSADPATLYTRPSIARGDHQACAAEADQRQRQALGRHRDRRHGDVDHRLQPDHAAHAERQQPPERIAACFSDVPAAPDDAEVEHAPSAWRQTGPVPRR